MQIQNLSSNTISIPGLGTFARSTDILPNQVGDVDDDVAITWLRKPVVEAMKAEGAFVELPKAPKSKASKETKVDGRRKKVSIEDANLDQLEDMHIACTVDADRVRIVERMNELQKGKS